MRQRTPQPRIVLVGAGPALERLCKDVCATHGWPTEQVSSLDSLGEDKNVCEILICDMRIPSQVESLLASRIHRASSEVLLVSPSPLVAEEDLLRRGADAVVCGHVDSAVLSTVLRSLVDSSLAGSAGLFRGHGMTILSAVYDAKTLAVHRPALHLAEELEAQGRLSAPDRRKLELAFQEAVTNALDHGSLELDSAWREQIDAQGRDRFAQLKAQRLSDVYYNSRKVVISFECSDDRYVIRVRDEGPGFSPPLAGTPAQPLPELKCSGRGIAIIVGSVDELSFAHDGREICMCKHVPLPPNGNKGCHGS